MKGGGILTLQRLWAFNRGHILIQMHSLVSVSGRVRERREMQMGKATAGQDATSIYSSQTPPSDLNSYMQMISKL